MRTLWWKPTNAYDLPMKWVSFDHIGGHFDSSFKIRFHAMNFHKISRSNFISFDGYLFIHHIHCIWTTISPSIGDSSHGIIFVHQFNFSFALFHAIEVHSMSTLTKFTSSNEKFPSQKKIVMKVHALKFSSNYIHFIVWILYLHF
jgi:hypothetical protein